MVHTRSQITSFLSLTTNICLGLLLRFGGIYSLWMPNLPIKRRHHRFLVPASSWPFPPQVWGHIALTEPSKIWLIVHILCYTYFIVNIFIVPPLSTDGILEQHFLSRFLGINTSLLRLEICLLFYPDFSFYKMSLMKRHSCHRFEATSLN